MTAVVWFRQDLRIADNDALHQACANHEQVVAVFTITEKQWQEHDWAPIKRDLLQRQLNYLQQDLAEKGVPLVILSCDYFRQLPAELLQLCQKRGAAALYANRDYPLHEVRRDRAVNAWLQRHGMECHWFDSNLLVKPGQVKTLNGTYYKKFTPFFKAWLKVLDADGIDAPQSLAGQRPKINNVHSIELAGEKKNSAAWAGSEHVVRDRLSRFLREEVNQYKTSRDVPALDATSRLSPFWELGVIAPRAAARLLQSQSPDFPYGLNEGPHTWLSELAWREFYQHLMWHVPKLSYGQAFQEYTEAYPWRHDQSDFKRWTEGRTGFPIVDAGMRQLLQEGWMHNRVRMIVANFLCKDLHIDWRWGERYFMQQLIDGSFAANNGGWQWSASTGTDAVPYFRVFNPTRQSQQVDPDGQYIRKWVKELEQVPVKHIHAPSEYLRARGETDYPLPMVEHKDARERFISTFKGLKNEK
ncbi:deoxyribodipyrimidine photo-lyase [Aliidiomarina minuta]|uniref:Deoxyribodipyrimidine photo-lyase n=1 Tax=Aliidiomarina minuta TaxID=880057 RepID=A0A432W6K0_9GAMM|nr:deoxyribodipyrimidine photo-lyase [Aliidiomarina minuta]RUO25596.1 deoxyribodipyrimidine photo-lyase [Aliidiomarina minuta]